MKLPYGQSNFRNVATEFYYVDRTAYIEQLEGLASRFLFYLRPRKFGKSRSSPCWGITTAKNGRASSAACLGSNTTISPTN